MKKNFFLIVVIFLGMEELVYAGISIGTAGTIMIANASNAPIIVAWYGTKTKDGKKSAVIQPGLVGSLDYTPETMIKIEVSYLQEDGKIIAGDSPLSFDPEFKDPKAKPRNLYVYGNKTVAMKDLDTTVAATPVPSRYVASWSGNIDVTAYPTPEAAIAAMSDKTKEAAALVNLYMMTIDGNNTRLYF